MLCYLLARPNQQLQPQKMVPLMMNLLQNLDRMGVVVVDRVIKAFEEDDEVP
jgi:hypothetical protein